MSTIKISIIYPVNRITAPLVSTLVRQFDLEISILHADISPNKVGTLIADVSGTEWNIEAGLKFIEEQGVEYELFNRRLIWNEDNCVNCGACTGVCPSNALSMSQDDWSLQFDKEKCLVCGLCVKACPLGVISLK